MSEKNLMLLALAAAAYVVFVHNGGLLKSTGETAASPAPPSTMPTDNTAAIAGAVSSTLDAITAIFNRASGSTATRGSGVSNV